MLTKSSRAITAIGVVDSFAEIAKQRTAACV
jgi:hypothetical protein